MKSQSKALNISLRLMKIALMLMIITFMLEVVGFLWLLYNLVSAKSLRNPALVIAIAAAFFMSSLYFKSWSNEKYKEADLHE